MLISDGGKFSIVHRNIGYIGLKLARSIEKSTYKLEQEITEAELFL